MTTLGIDIGGTKIAFGLVSPAGDILAQTRIPTDVPSGFDSAMDRLQQAIDQLLAGSQTPLAAVGIGSPGPFDSDGTIRDVPTLHTWRGQNPLAFVRRCFGVPAVMENDADSALLGEAWVGAARGASSAAMLAFGTGVGGAALVSGQLLRGAGGEHPELGHIPLDPAGPLCVCGLRGCLEIVASGTALNAAAPAAGFADARALFAAAKAGNPTARTVTDNAARIVALGAATLVHAVLPEIIVFGGGVMEEHFDLFRPAIAATLANLTPFAHRPTRIARAALGNNAGLIGAAHAAMRHMNRP
jgi:glucokinase